MKGSRRFAGTTLDEALSAAGGKGFKLRDEIYQFKDPYTRDDRRVLLSLDLSDKATGDVGAASGGRKDNDYAVAWIKNVGQGRGFYCSLGHAQNVFQDAAVNQFYLDGIQFALGDLPNKLFVSRYAVEMPKKQEMEAFLKQLGKEIDHEG